MEHLAHKLTDTTESSWEVGGVIQIIKQSKAASCALGIKKVGEEGDT